MTTKIMMKKKWLQGTIMKKKIVFTVWIHWRESGDCVSEEDPTIASRKRNQKGEDPAIASRKWNQKEAEFFKKWLNNCGCSTFMLISDTLFHSWSNNTVAHYRYFSFFILTASWPSKILFVKVCKNSSNFVTKFGISSYLLYSFWNIAI